MSKNTRQFREINEGKTFPFRYDRRHELKALCMYQLSPRTSLSLLWFYGSGEAITLETANYYGYYPYPGIELHGGVGLPQQLPSADLFESGRNGFRMRATHRLDIGISNEKQLHNSVRTWQLGLYNAYNRRNPLYYFFMYSGPGDNHKKTLFQYSLFPVLPYLSYKRSF